MSAARRPAAAPRTSDVLASVCVRLDRVKGPDHRGWYEACCPYHEERDPSFGFTATGFKCQACGRNGSIRELAARLGVELTRDARLDDRIVAAYDYPDEKGALVFQSVRLCNPKDFRQRRPDGAGGWIWNLTGVQLVSYRLPEVLSTPMEQALFVVEGEKDADRLWVEGVPATTNPMGAGKWRNEYSAYLRGRHVVIIPDNDEAGRRHAEQVAKSLHHVAADLRILDLPNLPEKGDVSDFFDAGGTAERLLDLAAECAKFEPRTETEPSAKRQIVTTGRFLHDVVEDGWAALNATNCPARFFQHGNAIAEIGRDDEGRARIAHLGLAGVRGRLDRSARWVKETRTGLVPARPPKDVVEDMEALEKPLPRLRGIVGTPTFASDGTLDSTTGYQGATCLYYEPIGEAVPPVPDGPDETDIKRAKQIIGHEWLGDFPFIDEASRANAIGAVVTAMARELINGPTPLFAFDAPSPGTGKGLLVTGLAIIVTGKLPPVMTEPRGEEELRKRITSLLCTGTPVVLFDNLKRRVESATLAALLTAPTWSDRILGRSQMVELPVRAIWLATGNNVQMDGEIVRRVAWVRLDAKVDRPWERTSFRHPDLVSWLHRHRHELVWAFLVLIRHWVARGKPAWDGRPLGSFESWSAVVGGVLKAAGIAGFLENREALYQRTDAVTEEWRQFTRAWWARHATDAVKATDLFDLAQTLLPSVFETARDGASERSLKTRLGKALAERRDQRLGDLFVRYAGQDSHNGGLLWRLEPAVDESGSADVGVDEARTSAPHPQDNASTPDSFADVADVADVESGVDSFFSPEEADTASAQNLEPIAFSHPHVPQHPHPGSKSGQSAADDARMSGAGSRPHPQCKRCRSEMGADATSNLCAPCAAQQPDDTFRAGADALIRRAETGMPAFVTRTMREIATEYGITELDTKTPGAIIEELRKKVKGEHVPNVMEFDFTGVEAWSGVRRRRGRPHV